MNRETLKQAIADAKTIKETAIANAKLALEEAFTPQLTAMFAEQLNEMDKEEVKEEEGVEENYSMEEGIEETFNIEEILAELSMEETDEPMEEGVTEELDEDLMLEEMSDEDIEALVAQVIDDMIASGKLMAGEESEEEDMEDIEDMGDEDEEIEIDIEDDEKDIDETITEVLSPEDLETALGVLLGMGSIPLSMGIAKLHDLAKQGKLGKSSIKVADTLEKIGTTVSPRNTGGGDSSMSETKEMEDTISELRNELNEVNLLNAKLLYTNKIFKAKNLTESDKIKVLNAFDKAENVKGVKLVYETLTESLKTTSIVKKSQIKESLGSASRAIAPATPKQPIVEVNEAFARMQKIAGLRK
jgi:hypothetical protein